MLIVLVSLRLIQRHRPINVENSANTASTGAHTGIGTAAMEFISSTGTCQVPVPVLAMRDGVHFQYGHFPSARTSIGIAMMEFISSTGTCQVPIPVLALPRWSSFPVQALAKCLYQYWLCYLLPKLVKSIVLWKNCDKKEKTSEFEYGYEYRYCAAPYRYW